MLKSYGVGGSQCLCGGASVYVVAYRILVSAPVPFWVFWVWGLKGLGSFVFFWNGDLWVWGLGLDNIFIKQEYPIYVFAKHVCVNIRFLGVGIS